MPQQRRSQARVEAILDAAAHTFAETGFDAATVESIAQRAGTSVGSIYQFYPNKLALFEALARRYLERSELLFGQLVSPAALARPWSELIDLVIDGFVAMQQADPGFRAIWANLQLYGVYAEADEALHRQFTRRLNAIVAAHAPDLAAEKRRLVSALIVQVVSGVMFLSARQGLSRTMVEELKLLLRRYLAPYVHAT